MKSKDNRSMVVERYTVTDRIAHTVHAIAMIVGILTGFLVYWGWGCWGGRRVGGCSGGWVGG